MSRPDPLARGSVAWGQKMSPAEAPALAGGLDGAVDDALLGWLLDPARPHWPLAFEARQEGQPLGRFLANLPRPGGPGFGFRLPLAALPPGEAVLELVEIGGPRSLRLAITARRTPVVADPVQPAVLRLPAGPPAEAAPPPPPLEAIEPPADPAELAARTEAAFRAEAWPEVVALTEAAAARPGKTDLRLMTWRGRALLYLRRFDAAVALLSRVMADHPTRHGTAFYLGMARLNRGEVAAAREVFLACLAAKPDEAKYVFEAGRATTRLATGDAGAVAPRPELAGEAMALLRQALDLLPEDPRPARDLAYLVLQAGEAEEALRLMRLATARAPRNGALRLEASRLLARLGLLEEALEAAREAVALDPQRDGAAFAVRILERWRDARRSGPFTVATLAPAP